MSNVYKEITRTFDMGAIVPGRRVPEHNEYSNRVKFSDLTNTFNKAIKNSKFEDVAIGQLKELYQDYKADIKNKKLDLTETKKHYKLYKDIVSKFLNSKFNSNTIKEMNFFINNVR